MAGLTLRRARRDRDRERGDRPGRRWDGLRRFREPRILVAAVVAVVSLSLGVGLAWFGRDDGSVEAPPEAGLPMPTVDDGGLEVPTPEGWQTVPVPNLGFGLALPPGWEVTVLSEDVLSSLERADPAVPHFVGKARAAAASGAVLYAAGVDDQDRITDLKVRAAPETGVADAEGLLDYGHQLVADDELAGATVEAVAGTARPTVQVAFDATGTLESGEEVPARGTETLVLGPRNIVWSLIVTSEVPEEHDERVSSVLGTLVFSS